MKAVILAGGLGTRISEESHLKPKPMIEVGGRPLLWHIMKLYGHWGINEFVVCCGYRGYLIKEYFSNYFLHMSDVTFDMLDNTMRVHHRQAEPWKVTLVNTGEFTQTGGRLKRVADYLDDTFCLTYGDGVADINIKELVAFHKQQGHKSTVTAIQPEARFGSIDIDGARVTRFLEKPKGDGRWISGGFFVLEPSVLDEIEGDESVWERDPLESLAAQGQLSVFKHDGFWMAMDTLRDKNHLEKLWPIDRRLGEFGTKVVLNWAGKRVFLTGHTGFKGAWLCQWLVNSGAELTGYSTNSPTDPSLFEQLKLKPHINHLDADIRDLGRLRKSLEHAKPDFVFHLAAQSLVRASYDNPLDTWSTNLMGTVNILEALRQLDRPCTLVAVTTDKVYRNEETMTRYTEEDQLGGHDPYSASKAACELAIASYRAAFPNQPIKIASARAGNVIGGGDWAAARLLPDIARCLGKGEPIKVRNPNSVRPWQHVLDPLAGYLRLAEALDSEKLAPQKEACFNFGPDAHGNRTVWDVVKAALRHWPGSAENISDMGAGHEAGLLSLSIEKAKQELGWKPVWDFETAIEQTISWYRLVSEGADPKDLTHAQLLKFQKEQEA